ncbi:hypothetical protein D3C86_2009010 [compost metagenome]
MGVGDKADTGIIHGSEKIANTGSRHQQTGLYPCDARDLLAGKYDKIVPVVKQHSRGQALGQCFQNGSLNVRIRRVQIIHG